MPLTNKRGRPRVLKQKRDLGTIEFQKKKMLGITGEPIDLCLQRKLITEDQHWAALHFRWLHNIRYGICLRGFDPTQISGQGNVEDVVENVPWYTAREREYKIALTKLDLLEARNLVIDLVIHNEWPRFLYLVNSKNFPARDRDALRKLKKSLSLLVNLWR